MGMEKQEYNIYAGLSGGFGGAAYFSTILAEGIGEAEAYAYEQAKQDYEMYEGLHGVKDWDEVAQEVLDMTEEQYYEYIEENDLTDKESSDIEVAYIEEMESWLDYKAVLTSEDTETDEDELIREHNLC